MFILLKENVIYWFDIYQLPAEPKILSTIISFNEFNASSLFVGIKTPLPPARPEAFFLKKKINNDS